MANNTNTVSLICHIAKDVILSDHPLISSKCQLYVANTYRYDVSYMSCGQKHDVKYNKQPHFYLFLWIVS